MNAVILHQVLVHRDAVHEELYPGHLELGRQVAVNFLEGLGIPCAVVGRDADAEQDNRSAAGLACFDDGSEISARALGGEAAESVVAAELENDDSGLEALNSTVYAAGATLGCLPANAGVDDPMFVPLSLQPRLQQSGPGLVNVYAEAGAQAVAKHQNGGRFRAAGRDRNQKQKKGQQFSHVE